MFNKTTTTPIMWRYNEKPNFFFYSEKTVAIESICNISNEVTLECVVINYWHYIDIQVIQTKELATWSTLHAVYRHSTYVSFISNQFTMNLFNSIHFLLNNKYIDTKPYSAMDLNCLTTIHALNQEEHRTPGSNNGRKLHHFTKNERNSNWFTISAYTEI